MLRVDSVSKNYEGVRALSDVTFEAKPNELIAVVGPNGAGTSTLLDAISGFVSIDRGRITLEGNDISSFNPWMRSHRWIARTFQHVKLTGTLTATENTLLQVRGQKGTNLIAALLKRKSWNEQEKKLVKRANHILRTYTLSESLDALADVLSFGQRKILSYCGAVGSQMPICLLDEPFAGLDPTKASIIAEGLSNVVRKGSIAIFVEHNLNTVAGIAHRVLAMDDGAIIADGSAKDVLSSRALRKAYFR